LSKNGAAGKFAGNVSSEIDKIMNFILIILQNLNILFNGLETGTQGSIDGYIVSLYIGIILSIVIILTQIFHKYYLKNGMRIKYTILLIFSLLLYIPNFDYLLYVTINGYSINDVIIGAVETDIASYAQNISERIYPIIFYIMITINVICLINVLRKNEV
jgi:hypothetical protein